MPAASLALLAGVIVAVVQIAEWIALPRAPTQFGSMLTLVGVGILLPVTAALGVLVVRRQASNAIGWLLCAAVALVLIGSTAGGYAYSSIAFHGRSLPAYEVAGWIYSWWFVPYLGSMLLFVPLLFPTGQLLSARWRPVAWVGAIAILAGTVGLAFSPGHTGILGLSNPLAVRDGTLGALVKALNYAFPLVLLSGLAAIASAVVRYRRSRGDEREQLKALTFIAASFVLVIVAAGAAGLFKVRIVLLEDLINIFPVLLPVGIGVAVLKYRLYDIDLVISRALVYGALAAFITAVYVGIVVGIGTLIGSGGRPNLALSIVATAVIAVGFQPVRERLQKVANGLVYGKRATPYEVLSQFSERVAESYAPDDVLPRMARVLADGTGAARADVWLRAGDILRQAASWPSDSAAAEPARVVGDSLPEMLDTDRAVEVRHQGELLGALTVTKRKGESLTPVEEKLLTGLAGQAGLVLKNVGLTAELLARLEDLRASRQRLVAAQDEERRRLERNLHDGAQQNLVALKVKLGLAEMFVEKDPARAKQTLAELKVDTDEALETLRDLARGIYPPLLADRGLVAALESQARKATVPVQVDADGVGRYPQEVEAAVYFCVLEALQNVQKYAAAQRAVVKLDGSEGGLTFEVTDDGQGFDGASVKRGAGLTNMTDRIDALGGRLEVSSTPERGTRVHGTLPALVAVAPA